MAMRFVGGQFDGSTQAGRSDGGHECSMGRVEDGIPRSGVEVSHLTLHGMVLFLKAIMFVVIEIVRFVWIYTVDSVHVHHLLSVVGLGAFVVASGKRVGSG